MPPLKKAQKENANTVDTAALEKMVRELVSIVSIVGERNKQLEDRIVDLEASVFALQGAKKEKPANSIHKVEDFNGEEIPEVVDNMKMQYEDKLDSIRNACAILPPNKIVNGRHTKENCAAICGFIVDDDMLDTVYATFKHDS